MGINLEEEKQKLSEIIKKENIILNCFDFLYNIKCDIHLKHDNKIIEENYEYNYKDKLNDNDDPVNFDNIQKMIDNFLHILAIKLKTL